MISFSRVLQLQACYENYFTSFHVYLLLACFRFARSKDVTRVCITSHRALIIVSTFPVKASLVNAFTPRLSTDPIRYKLSVK